MRVLSDFRLVTRGNQQSEARLTFSDWGEDVQTSPTLDRLTLPFSGQHLQTANYENTASKLVHKQDHQSKLLLSECNGTSCCTVRFSKRCVSSWPLGPRVCTEVHKDRKEVISIQVEVELYM